MNQYIIDFVVVKEKTISLVNQCFAIKNKENIYQSEYNPEMNDSLKIMGMTNAFDWTVADFDGIGISKKAPEQAPQQWWK